jgi:hypothetical protein
MYVFPASHLKVHAAIEPGLAGEQSVFAFFCSCTVRKADDDFMFYVGM